MPSDANVQLQSLVTKATAFASTGVDLKTGTPRRGLKARWNIPAYFAAGAGAIATPTIQGSSDNTTFVDVAYGTALTLTTATQQAEQNFSFESSYRYFRANLQMTPTTSSPSVAYQVDLMIARP